jgi:hypothetical protein
MNRRVMKWMGLQHLRSLLRLSPIVSVLTLGACASVLGIEDLSSGPAPGAGADGTGNNGTGNNGTGNSSSGGNSGGGGKTPGGGSDSEAGDGSVNGGNGNTSGSNNVPIAGDGNVPGDPTVRGKLIDFWGHVLPNVAIQIGETLTSSDENGEFVFEDVPATYDVSFHVTFTQYSQTRSFGWVFQGLTRRDPTLQVSWGLPVRSGNILVDPENVTEVAENQNISVSIGGDDGNWNIGDVGANGVQTSATWEGGDTTAATAHGLYFQFDEDTDFPTSYLAHDSSLVSLEDSSEQAQITLDLTPGTLPAGNLQGTVNEASGTDRENSVFLRFDSGATIPLLSHSGAEESFTYLVPTIPNSSITVAASEGDSSYGGVYAVAHANGLAASSEAPELVIPTPATLTSPADQLTGVDETTNFAFQSPASNPGPFVVQFDNVDTTPTAIWQTLYVVTAGKQLTMPEVVGGGFALQKGKIFEWRVATHGSFSSVDEMAGPSGYLDPFAVEAEPVGPNLEDGQYTISASRYFTSAP